MKSHNQRVAAFVLISTVLTLSGCDKPKLEDKELGTVHNTIPKLDGDDRPVQFPRPVKSLPGAQSTGVTVPVAQPTASTLPAVAPTGTSQPAAQPSGATLPAAGSKPVVQGT